jgi:hypothetical protein
MLSCISLTLKATFGNIANRTVTDRPTVTDKLENACSILMKCARVPRKMIELGSEEGPRIGVVKLHARHNCHARA